MVAGLLSVGVRQGESVGVLMDTRPSMLIAVAALNRIGAVVVLLRPDGSLTEEIKLGGAARIVTDPEHVESVRARTDAEVFVLGGGGGQRDLGVDGVIDLERIDPAEVILPTWYRPNPGLARETAFVLFTGDGPSTKARMITNARWARAAFGTATSAELRTARHGLQCQPDPPPVRPVDVPRWCRRQRCPLFDGEPVRSRHVLE